MANQELIDYDFNCINLSDYEVIFTLYTENKFLKDIFNKAKETLKRKKVIDKNINAEEIDKINKIDIDFKYYSFIGITFKPFIKKLYLLLKADKIEILNDKISECFFIRNPDNKEMWLIKLKVTGQYVDKR